MDETGPKDPLHGLTLKAVVEDLVSRRGWPWLAEQIPLRCFSQEPSISSSLGFLRRTPWARGKVERLYVKEQRRIKRNARRKWRASAKKAHDAATGTEAGEIVAHSEPESATSEPASVPVPPNPPPYLTPDGVRTS